MIKIERLQKSFVPGRTALDIERLEIPPRQTLVVIGPSGCGKSTLLRLIMGLLKPDSGVIAIDGEILDEKNSLRLRQKMGYVIQEGGLFPHLSAAQNVTLMARRLRWEPPRIEHRLEELRELVNLSPDHLRRYPLELSGGERQRLSLMRALFLNPPIVLFDEPLGALDPMIRVRLQTDLKKIFSRIRHTIVFITHDMAEAVCFADQIMLMKDGRPVQRGTPSDLLKKPGDPFVTEFIKAQKPPRELYA